MALDGGSPDGPKGLGKILRITPDIDAHQINRAASLFISSPDFKDFTHGLGLYDRPGFGHEYERYVRDWTEIGQAGDLDHLALAFVEKFRTSASQIGAKLYDGLRVVGDRLTTNKCGYCASPVSAQDMDTVFARMSNLKSLSPDQHPDLVWDDKFLLKCSSCGAPGTDIDLSPVMQRWSVAMAHEDEHQYFWRFQRDKLIGVDIGLGEFINTGILLPFREGKQTNVSRMVLQLKSD